MLLDMQVGHRRRPISYRLSTELLLYIKTIIINIYYLLLLLLLLLYDVSTVYQQFSMSIVNQPKHTQNTIRQTDWLNSV